MKKAKKRACLSSKIAFRQRARFSLFTHNVFSLPISCIHNVSDYNLYRKLKVKEKNLLWQFPVQKKKKVFNIGLYTTELIIIPYILGLGAKTKEKIF
jgi:hypothetical protein